MVKTIGNKKEIIRTAIFLSDGTENTENLNAPGVVLISEETYRKIINDLTGMKEKESIATEDIFNDLDSDRLSQVDKLMSDAHASENDILNLEEEEEEETDKLLPDSNSSINVTDVNNDFKSNKETDALLAYSHSSINVTVNTSQAVSIDNQISIGNDCVTDNQQAENNRKSVESMLNNQPLINVKKTDELLSTDYQHVDESMPNGQPSINVISGILEQTTLAENSTQADDIGLIQDNDYESFTQLDSSQSLISLQDNTSDEQNSLITTEHEQISKNEFNMELVNKDSSVKRQIEQVTKSKYPESKLLNYVKLLKKTREVKEKPESFTSQDPKSIFKMFTQPINRYFNKVSEVLIEPEPFPKIMEDVQSCSKYLEIWNLYYNNCNRLIELQDLKKLKLIYLLAEVFFNMLKIYHQEQVKNTSSFAKNTNT
ncbi:9335_t:CDS:2 [Racocetra persica]|uniref:9335_t:CDS:1 n=1 Tax=Racocetra persica TaxID=160502 RepID=A0ACA9KRN1_9GLOM|nr:9335_t:CDS:2 [Racocetra persica]